MTSKASGIAFPASAGAPAPRRRIQPLVVIRRILPALVFALMLALVGYAQPRVLSYNGLTLMLGLGLPIALATLSQMLIMTIGDIDLSTGPFVSLVACIGSTMLASNPLLALLILVACIVCYAAMGAVIQIRRLPSIVVTLGFSFIWTGFAVVTLPSPGGQAPDWLQTVMSWRSPFVPLPILGAGLAGLLLYWLLMRSSFGVLLRGAGGSPLAMTRARRSLIGIRMFLYGLAGLFGVLSGLSLLGIATSGDANMASGYTLLSIAGVILGGGEFTGGRVSPIGAIFGALTLALIGTLLTSVQIAAEWQIGAQGLILALVLAIRVVLLARNNRGQA